MSALRRLKAYALGHNTDIDQTAAQLREADIPTSDEPCRGCADPCDVGHDEFPRFDVDMETEMLGSIKPYGRQIVISTGKSDWEREVTDVKGSLAAHISDVSSSAPVAKAKEPKNHEDKKHANSPSVSGVFTSDLSKVKKVTILNGSHRTVSDDHSKETILVFPDYKVVTQIDNSQEGAAALWDHALSPSIGFHSVPRNASTSDGPLLKSWIIPYSCVILLCSHKRRDNRCAIAAPKLEHSLTLALEREGWEVHTQLDDPSASGPALEDDPSLHPAPVPRSHANANGHAPERSEKEPDVTEANGEKHPTPAAKEHQHQHQEPHGGEDDDSAHELVRARLQSVDVAHAEHKRALILYTSHIGGHKYAGNVIINTPRGVSVWYGRVTPHEVDAIVKETIVGGRVLPRLLRGGLNLCYPGHKSLNDW